MFRVVPKSSYTYFIVKSHYGTNMERERTDNMYGTVVECGTCLEWGYLVDNDECIYCVIQR